MTSESSWLSQSNFPRSFTDIRGDTNALLLLVKLESTTHRRDPQLLPHPEQLERIKPGTSSSHSNGDTDSKEAPGHAHHSYAYSMDNTSSHKQGLYIAITNIHSLKYDLCNSVLTQTGNKPFCFFKAGPSSNTCY